MKRIGLALSLGLLVTSITHAQPGQRGGQFRPPDPFKDAIDANSDGEISKAELAGASERIRSLDADGDGSITMREVMAAMRSSMSGRGSGRSTMSGGSRALEAAGLAVGKPLPDVIAFDDQGHEFRLADMKGEYSVVVFGCLT